jgi:hypothetical protein
MPLVKWAFSPFNKSGNVAWISDNVDIVKIEAMRPYFNSSYLIKVNYKKYLKLNEQVGVVKRTKWMKFINIILLIA